MDQRALDALKQAYEAAPENPHLLAALVQAYWDRGEPRKAVPLFESRGPEAWPPGADLTAPIDICLEVGLPYKALALAVGDAPQIALRRARAHLALKQFAEARREYETAIAANPTLEDPELKAELREPERAPPPESLPSPGLENAPFDPAEAETRRMIQPSREVVTFAEVGGLEGVKKEIHKRIIMPFLKPGLFKRFKRRTGGGILLYGAPGCGKTLLARATAGECQAAFYNVTIADVLSGLYGESEFRLKALFEKARSSTPAVLFFDEIEALGGKRQYSHDAHTAKLVSQFLSEMDGFAETNEGVLILAATNVPWSVDSAFRRPGRFDRVLFVPPPDRPAREAILKILLLGIPGGESIDAGRFAAATSGFSGADLKNLVETAADFAIEDSLTAEREAPLSDRHLKDALDSIKPTTIEWLTTARNYARYANETGHYDEVLDFLKHHGKG